MPPRSKTGAKTGRKPKSTKSASKPSVQDASANSSIIQDKLRQGPKKLGFLMKSSQNDSTFNSSRPGSQSNGVVTSSFQEDDGFFYSRSQPSQSQSQSKSQSLPRYQSKRSLSQYSQPKSKSLRLNNFTKGKSIFDDDDADDENDAIFGRPIAQEFKRKKQQEQSKQRSVSAPVKLNTLSSSIPLNAEQKKSIDEVEELLRQEAPTISKSRKPTAKTKRNKTPIDDLHDSDKEEEVKSKEKLTIKKSRSKKSTIKTTSSVKPKAKSTTSTKKTPSIRKTTHKKASVLPGKSTKTLLDVLDDTFEYDSDEEEDDKMFSLETPVKKKQKLAIKPNTQKKTVSKSTSKKIPIDNGSAKPTSKIPSVRKVVEVAKKIDSEPTVPLTKKTIAKTAKKRNSEPALTSSSTSIGKIRKTRTKKTSAKLTSTSTSKKKAHSKAVEKEPSPTVLDFYDDIPSPNFPEPTSTRGSAQSPVKCSPTKDEDQGPEVTTTIIPLNFSPLKRSLVKTRQERRRSSLGNRGKRISSIGNGFQAEPHNDIPLDQLYKHFDSDLPDPHKMRQLLVWCAKRTPISSSLAESSKKNNSGRKSIGEKIANVIRDEMIRDLADGRINTSWWNTEDNENALNDDDDDTTTKDGSQRPIVIRPNEANIENKKLYDMYDKRLQDLTKEKTSWLQAKPSVDEVNTDLDLGEENLNHIIKEKIEKLERMMHVLNNYKTKLDQNKLIVFLENFKLTIHKLKESKNLINSLTDNKLEEISKRMKYLIDHDNDGNKVESADLLRGLVEF